MSGTSYTAAKRSPGSSSNWRDRLEIQRGSDSLSLVDLFIGDEGAYEVAKFLKNNRDYTSLQLRGNNISAAGFEAICQALKSSNRVKTITAEWNNIGSDISGLVALHDLLKVNSSIENIDLKNNRLNSNSSRVIADIITDSVSLKKLDLRWNELGEDGGRTVLNALQETYRKLAIDLNGNKVPEEVLAQINDPQANPSKTQILQIEEKREVTRDLQAPVSSRYSHDKPTQSTMGREMTPPKEDLYHPLNAHAEVENQTSSSNLLSSKYTFEPQNYQSKYSSFVNTKTFEAPVSVSKYHNTTNTLNNYGTDDYQSKSLVPSTQTVVPTDAKITTYSHTYSPIHTRTVSNAKYDTDHLRTIEMSTKLNPERFSHSVKQDISARGSYEYKSDLNKKFDTGMTTKYQHKYGVVAGGAALSQSIAPLSEMRHDSTLKRSAINTNYETIKKDSDVNYATETENLKVGKLISELERALERERTRANEAEGKLFTLTREHEVESNLRQEFEKKYLKVAEDLKKADIDIHGLKIEVNGLTSENGSLKSDVSILKQQNEILEENSRKKTGEIEERYKLQIKVMETQSQSLREELVQVQRQLNGQILDLRRDFEGKSRKYEDQINEFAKLNDELSSELASQLEFIERMKIESEHNLKRSVAQARDEETSKSQIVIRGLEDELRNLKVNHEQVSRKNAEMLVDLQAYEKQIRDQHIQFGNELSRVGGEIEKLRAELQQANLTIQKQNGDLASKNTTIGKLENEIELLRGEVQRIVDKHMIQIENFKREYESERKRFEDNERQLLLKIEDYDRRLAESHTETVRITREYDKLVEAIQGNVSRVIHDTFVTHKNTSEIKNIEHRFSTVSTPNRNGTSKMLFGSAERKLL